MKRVYSGLHRRLSQTRSSGGTSSPAGQNDEKPKPRRSSSLALLEGATSRPRSGSNTTTQAHSSSNTGPAHLVLTTDSHEIDPVIVRHFQEEGFSVSFLPYTGDPKDYDTQLQQLEDPLEAGDKYAIVGMLNSLQRGSILSTSIENLLREQS